MLALEFHRLPDLQVTVLSAGEAFFELRTQLHFFTAECATFFRPTLVDPFLLVIAAAEDPLRTAEEIEELVEAIPNTTLKVIEQSGHMLPLEQPKSLADTIKQWLGLLENTL